MSVAVGFRCARCNTHLDVWVFSPWTKQRYCVDIDECSDRARRQEDGPTDDDIYNGPGVEGGIAYDTDEPGSLGENDWRL